MASRRDLEPFHLGHVEAEKLPPDVMIEANNASRVRAFGNHGSLPCPMQSILESGRSCPVVHRSKTSLELLAKLRLSGCIARTSSTGGLCNSHGGNQIHKLQRLPGQLQ